MKKINLAILSLMLCGALTIVTCNLDCRAAEMRLNEDEQVVSLNVDSSMVDAQLTIDENEMMWIEDDSIYKMEIIGFDTNNQEQKSCTEAYVKISEKAIDKEGVDETPINILRQQNKYDSTESQIYSSSRSALVKSDQAWDSSYTLKITLSVNYNYANNSLRIYSASGSYSRAAYNGVTVTSGTLRYSATGQIYQNGKFQRNGTVSKTVNSDSGKFTNTSLMGNNLEVRVPVIGGVVYTLYATRGVTVEVSVPVV